jgi:glycosyltransferase involved in cell wall biosynthesis
MPKFFLSKMTKVGDRVRPILATAKLKSRWIAEVARRKRAANNPHLRGAAAPPRLSLRRFSPSKIKLLLGQVKRTLVVVHDEVRLLKEGAESILPPQQAHRRNNSQKSLYLVYNSLPYHSAGYATRTHGLVKGLRELGLDTTILTRLGYPRIFPKYLDVDVPNYEEVDGIPYLRLNADMSGIFGLSTSSYLRRNISASLEAAVDFKPAVIHGASNFVTGLTAIGVARAMGVPSVYEVRGLWEVTALSRDPAYSNSLHYAQAVRLETEACLGADRVIAITQALKDELIRRGVPAEKIDVVPNGVDTDRFRPLPRDIALAEKLGLKPEHVVVGYVGSILDYEGLDDLLRAVRLCVDRGHENLRVLIVGDGAAYESCIDLAQDLNLNDYVIFTGRVPHGEVESYYSLVDIAPFPRKPLPVCEMVSPLKPFEAMAMGKCIIVSSVAALAEIIGDRPIGFVSEKGSIEALAQTISLVVNDGDLRAQVGEAARRFVILEHDWRALAHRVAQVYEKLTVEGVERVS